MGLILDREKLMKNDEHKQYTITVLGEEAHVAYNRVGLTSFFEHRNIEELYLNPEEWYSQHPETLHHQISTQVISINTEKKTVATSTGHEVPYDILVLSSGSDAVVPASTPGHDAEGVFVYRNIEDLEKMIGYSKEPRAKESVGLVVGGGLLGLEAAKAVMDLESYKSVKLIDKNPWVLSRQLDQDAGRLVIEKVEDMGLEVMSQKRIKEIVKNERNQVSGVIFEDGQKMDDVGTICYAVSFLYSILLPGVALTGNRLASKHETSSQRPQGLRLPKEVVILSTRTAKPMFLGSTRLASVHRGTTKHSG
jgi:nitrite reductase (NAD(P)H)